MTSEVPTGLAGPAKPKSVWTPAPIEPKPYQGDPWSRQTSWKESDQAYAAFLVYRDLDPADRTVAKARDALKAKGRNVRQIYRWAKDYRWSDRTAAFDAFMDAAEVQAIRRRRVEAARRHADQSAQVQLAMMQPIRVYNERLLAILGGRADQLDEMSDADLLRLGRETAKILADHQKAERDALSTVAGERSIEDVQDSEKVQIRAKVLRELIANRDSISMMETLQFQVTDQLKNPLSDQAGHNPEGRNRHIPLAPSDQMLGPVSDLADNPGSDPAHIAGESATWDGDSS